MKKMMCITGLILLVCLLISGCADQQAQKQTPEDVSQDDKETIMPIDQQDESSMDSVISNVSAITQEELDQLKADIEKLESEDLGGLSND